MRVTLFPPPPPPLSFATRFTVVPMRVHGLICPRNVHRPFSMIDRPRDKRESTLLTITVIILAFAVAFYALRLQ